MALNILKSYDLKAMGHNSADYIHVVTEALKLAFADRHNYFGDPEMVKIPINGLMSERYAQWRASLIDLKNATPGMPPAGNPRTLQQIENRWMPEPESEEAPGRATHRIFVSSTRTATRCRRHQATAPTTLRSFQASASFAQAVARNPGATRIILRQSRLGSVRA
jgi:gamma-glutamyltranspeptidase/glutathione hydrolase